MLPKRKLTETNLFDLMVLKFQVFPWPHVPHSKQDQGALEGQQHPELLNCG